MSGLLTTSGKRTEPERVTLLLFTIGFALYYFLTTATTPIDQLPGGLENPSLPDVSPETLVALFGVQSTFLIGKILRQIGLNLP